MQRITLSVHNPTQNPYSEELLKTHRSLELESQAEPVDESQRVLRNAFRETDPFLNPQHAYADRNQQG